MRCIRCLFTQITGTTGHGLYVIEPLTAGACAYPACEWGCPRGSGTRGKVRNVSVKRISNTQVPEVKLRKLHWITTRFGLHLVIERCTSSSMVGDYGILDPIGVLIPEFYYLLLLLCVSELRVIKDAVYDCVELLDLIAYICAGTYILYS